MRRQGGGLRQLELVDVVVLPYLSQELVNETHDRGNLCDEAPKVNELLVYDELQIPSQLAYIVEQLFLLELVTLL
ncbi:MAG: hypothetical protein ACMG6E_10055 [Candidatus Roizmanbacteria bacterium]